MFAPGPIRADALRRFVTRASRSHPALLARRYPNKAVPAARHLATAQPRDSVFDPLDTFADRHIGPNDSEASFMLEKLGYASMDAFVSETVPEHIRVDAESLNNDIITPLTESELFARARELASKNKVFKNYIGMGYFTAVVPPVILRNVRLS